MVTSYEVEAFAVLCWDDCVWAVLAAAVEGDNVLGVVGDAIIVGVGDFPDADFVAYADVGVEGVVDIAEALRSGDGDFKFLDGGFGIWGI